ncbi:MAG: type IX secretion system sortase PorU [bacterium]
MENLRYISLALAILLFLLMGAPCANAAYGDIELVRSDQFGCQFRLSIPPDLSNLTDIATDPDSTHLVRTVHIGLPPGAHAQLIDVRGDQPRQLPSPRFDKLSMSPAPLALVSPPTTIRDRRMVAITINPVQNGLVYGSVEVIVSFQGGNTDGGRVRPDPQFARVFKSLLLNSDQALKWPVPLRPMAKAASTPFGTVSEWHKLFVQSTGLIRVSGRELAAAGVVLNGVSSDLIRVFCGGGEQLPFDNAQSRPELEEIALLIRDGDDGQFDSVDTLYFYSQSLNRWDLSEAQPQFIHNNYARSNVYWLSISTNLPGPAQRMLSQDVTPGGGEDTIITDYNRFVHAEQDSMLYQNVDGRVLDYYRWWWTDAWQPTIYVPTPDAIEGRPAEIFVSSKVYRPDTLYELSVNGMAADRGDCQREVGCYFETADIMDGLNRLDLYFVGSGAALPYMDYVDVGYVSRLVPVGDRLEAALTVGRQSSARIEIVNEFSDQPLLLDISEPRRPMLLTGFDTAAGLVTLGTTLYPDQARQLFGTTYQKAVTPDSIVETVVTDLRAVPGQTDLLIVTTDDLMPSLAEYVDYRRRDGISIRIVDVDDIYDNFSWGLFDPAAIRDFLKYAYETYPEPAPSAVLFVGDGNYDFLGHTPYQARNLVPPFINGGDDSYTYNDDNYLFFGTYGFLDSDTSYTQVPDRGVDMLSARWPVKTSAEIRVIMDKIRRYEAAANLGPWRSTVVLVADDEFTNETSNEDDHTIQSEGLTDVIPRRYRRSKIYSIEHAFVNNRKPTVNQAIVDAVNDGCLMMNYVGHGNPLLLAHEHIFTAADDLPRLNNYDRLPLFFAASCALGFFDSPQQEGMAEELLTYAGGGAVAVISATRLVYSLRNHAYNRAVCEYLFGDEPLTVAEAVFAAKVRHQYSGSASQARNDRAYVLFGDPYLRLGTPPWTVVFDTNLDSLVALQPQQVAGHIVDRSGLPVMADGTARIQVFDSDRQKIYNSKEHGGTADPIDYNVDGASVYRGSAAVEAGQFEFSFVTPLDIGYGGTTARIEAYAELDTVDALGVLQSIRVSNQIAAVEDSTGPEITFSFGERVGFVDGDAFAPGDPLHVTLSDSSGINLTGWLGHTVSLVIDGLTEEAVNLTDLFEYDSDDHTTGRITYPLGGLAAGEHHFKIKAWDNANNSSVVEFAGELVGVSATAVREVLNYPNPMSDSTLFAFEAVVPLQTFRLEIFTLSGRKIQSISLYSLDAGYHQDIIWRGTDFAGDRVATGVYVYKATARPVSSSNEAELYGKVVVIN